MLTDIPIAEEAFSQIGDLFLVDIPSYTDDKRVRVIIFIQVVEHLLALQLCNRLLEACVIAPQRKSRPHGLINQQAYPFLRVITSGTEFFENNPALFFNFGRIKEWVS